MPPSALSRKVTSAPRFSVPSGRRHLSRVAIWRSQEAHCSGSCLMVYMVAATDPCAGVVSRRPGSPRRITRSAPGPPHPGPDVGGYAVYSGPCRFQPLNLMSGPNPLPGPEAGEGNRFIYARTPWGLTVELISYPAPMSYTERSDARRWRPMPIGR